MASGLHTEIFISKLEDLASSEQLAGLSDSNKLVVKFKASDDWIPQIYEISIVNNEIDVRFVSFFYKKHTSLSNPAQDSSTSQRILTNVLKSTHTPPDLVNNSIINASDISAAWALEQLAPEQFNQSFKAIPEARRAQVISQLSKEKAIQALNLCKNSSDIIGEIQAIEGSRDGGFTMIESPEQTSANDRTQNTEEVKDSYLTSYICQDSQTLKKMSSHDACKLYSNGTITLDSLKTKFANKPNDEKIVIINSVDDATKLVLLNEIDETKRVVFCKSWLQEIKLSKTMPFLRQLNIQKQCFFILEVLDEAQISNFLDRLSTDELTSIIMHFKHTNDLQAIVKKFPRASLCKVWNELSQDNKRGILTKGALKPKEQAHLLAKLDSNAAAACFADDTFSLRAETLFELAFCHSDIALQISQLLSAELLMTFYSSVKTAEQSSQSFLTLLSDLPPNTKFKLVETLTKQKQFQKAAELIEVLLSRDNESLNTHKNVTFIASFKDDIHTIPIKSFKKLSALTQHFILLQFQTTCIDDETNFAHFSMLAIKAKNFDELFKRLNAPIIVKLINVGDIEDSGIKTVGTHPQLIEILIKIDSKHLASYISKITDETTRRETTHRLSLEHSEVVLQLMESMQLFDLLDFFDNAARDELIEKYITLHFSEDQYQALLTKAFTTKNRCISIIVSHMKQDGFQKAWGNIPDELIKDVFSSVDINNEAKAHILLMLTTEQINTLLVNQRLSFDSLLKLLPSMNRLNWQQTALLLNQLSQPVMTELSTHVDECSPELKSKNFPILAMMNDANILFALSRIETSNSKAKLIHEALMRRQHLHTSPDCELKESSPETLINLLSHEDIYSNFRLLKLNSQVLVFGKFNTIDEQVRLFKSAIPLAQASLVKYFWSTKNKACKTFLDKLTSVQLATLINTKSLVELKFLTDYLMAKDIEYLKGIFKKFSSKNQATMQCLFWSNNNDLCLNMFQSLSPVDQVNCITGIQDEQVKKSLFEQVIKNKTNLEEFIKELSEEDLITFIALTIINDESHLIETLSKIEPIYYSNALTAIPDIETKYRIRTETNRLKGI